MTTDPPADPAEDGCCHAAPASWAGQANHYWESWFVVVLNDKVDGPVTVTYLRDALRAYTAVRIDLVGTQLIVRIRVGPTTDPQAAAEYARARLAQAVDHGQVSPHPVKLTNIVDLGP